MPKKTVETDETLSETPDAPPPTLPFMTPDEQADFIANVVCLTDERVKDLAFSTFSDGDAAAKALHSLAREVICARLAPHARHEKDARVFA